MKQTSVLAIGLRTVVVVIVFYLFVTLTTAVYSGGLVGGWQTTVVSIAIQAIGIPPAIMLLTVLWRWLRKSQVAS